MSVDLMFLAHNRAEFTRASFDTLLANTDWDLVRYLYIVDDCSSDGAYEYLDTAAIDVPCNTSLVSGAFGGPVAAMNEILDRTDATILGKIDSDVIVCPNWLNQMQSVLDGAPEVDALGMEPGFADAVQPPEVPRNYKYARWIGGVGLFRTRVFKRARPVPHQRFFGWTQFQRRHVNAAWITPDLPMFLLDHLPVEPWLSLTDQYVAEGWQRPWSKYTPGMEAYYDWWLNADVERRMETAGR
jgi:glycosyltransferase involved in cell wall biosynthesis